MAATGVIAGSTAGPFDVAVLAEGTSIASNQDQRTQRRRSAQLPDRSRVRDNPYAGLVLDVVDAPHLWPRGADPVGVLAIAQMGVHLVFFLHISSAPDQTNNFLALAFGIFVVGLVVFGSMIIMANLNHAMMPMDRLMQMQR
jgi:hypothetical protein